MPTLWFSYSNGGGTLDSDEPLMSPYTIYWHAGRFLRDQAAAMGYDFRYVNLDDTTPRTFEPDDIAIGHCWWSGGFMHQALAASIRAKFVLQPYTHGMVAPGDTGMVLDLWERATHLFLITGQYWHITMKGSPYAALYDYSTRLDMAVNAQRHHYYKALWNKPGKRAFLCIGADTPTKGYRNVAELAIQAGFRLGHYGNARPETFADVPQMTLHGGTLFTPEVVDRICRDYDAVIAMPALSGDANPTVLLEAAAWGLPVFCTKEAGYLPGKPFRELRFNDPAFNLAQVRAFQQESEYDLIADSLALRSEIERKYNWQRFCSTLWQKAETFL